MAKRISLTMVREDVTAVAELHEDLAPETSKAFWSVLPYEGIIRHSQFIGHFFWSSIGDPHRPDPVLTKIPKENWTMYPEPGELVWVYFPPAWLGGPKGLSTYMYDFLVCYGPESSTRVGYDTVNVFGKVIENLDGLAEGAKNLLMNGEDVLRIERIEGDFEPMTRQWVDWAELDKVGPITSG